MDRIRNELKNAAGFALKLRVIVDVQDLEINFYKQIFVPSSLLANARHFVCFDDGTGYIQLF